MGESYDKADIVDVNGAFANADETVINWKGENYYQACSASVVESPDGSGTFCVKRVDHPGDIHEDYDGVRKTVDQGRMAVVVTFNLVADTQAGFDIAQGILGELKPLFKDKEDVKVYGAIKDKADQIIMILDGDG